MTRLVKTSLSAVILAALCAAAQAEPDPVTFQVDFTYTAGAPAGQIQDELDTTARSACFREARRLLDNPSARRSFIPDCREQLVALASAEIGLTALAAGHGRETGAPMTVTVYAQLD